MTKYQKFRSEFEASGLTQKDYAKTIGVTSSTVCTRLKRAREDDDMNSFQSIVVDQPSNACIKIILPNGTTIEVPV